MSGVSKQAYHKGNGVGAARRAAREAFALEYIRGVRAKARGIGGGKLWQMYRRDVPEADRVGRDKFWDIIDRHGLKVRRKRRKPRTTDSTHGLPLYPNLVRDFIPEAANQLWVSDITYMPVWLGSTGYAFCYLSLDTDAYSREIVGWGVGGDLGAGWSVQALEMALCRLGNDGGGTAAPMHHSDRGVQYASRDYTDILKRRHMRISMTENGDPKENAVAERVNSTVKNELLGGMRFTSVEEVRAAVAAAVDFYNNERPHMSLDMMTPAQAAQCTGEVRKRWRSFRDEAIKGAAG